jgi:uncharacterized protein (DUF2267 family)
MDSEKFIEIVEREIGSDRVAAERATSATLQTLAERIDREEARQLAAQLPAEIAPLIATATPAQRVDVDEFLQRLSQREGVDVVVAQHHAAAVLDALARAVSEKEWSDMVSELPRNFAPLLPRGPYVAVLDADTFLRRVAERAGTDLETARRATDAVLETLAERIAGGEVDDLIVRLPPALHPPLKRGRVRTGGRASAMKLKRFVELVAEREPTSFAVAALHARAVLGVLREAIGEEVLRDITVQLPQDYVRILGHG